MDVYFNWCIGNYIGSRLVFYVGFSMDEIKMSEYINYVGFIFDFIYKFVFWVFRFFINFD